MLVAGEASGDLLAAELVRALGSAGAARGFALNAFGAGGPRMAAAGVNLTFDLTAHAVIGLWEALRNLGKFRRFLLELADLACERRPDVIVTVDFNGFNRRFVHCLKERVRALQGAGDAWNPRFVHYVLPQVWASRPGRAKAMAKDYDLVLSIFPFEPAWCARNVPELKVAFVGHPIIDRYPEGGTPLPASPAANGRVLLLPGSRVGELKRHLPAVFGAWEMIRQTNPHATCRMVLPSEALLQLAKQHGLPASVQVQIGGLAQALRETDVALACTGTVTVECAYFGVPTVAFYKTSWFTYQVGKRVVQVKYLAMPNLLADELLFPEFIQHDATPPKLARAALELMENSAGRTRVRQRLAEVAASLGQPGASSRAAQAILELLPPTRP